MQEQVQHYLDYLSAEKKASTHTTLAYRNDLTQLVDFVQLLTGPNRQPVRTWKQITAAHIQAYVAYVKAQGYASSTVARKLAAVRSLFEFMLEQNAIAPTQDEINRLLEAPTQQQGTGSLRDRAMFELLYATGMRVSELVGMDVGDVDIQKKLVQIDRSGSRSRVAAIDDSVSEALRQYLIESRVQLLIDPHEVSLFLNQRGQRLTRQGLWLIIKQYVTLAGIKKSVTPHVLRHSFVANQIEKGTQPRDIRQRLGNTSPISTQAYKGQQPKNQLIIDGKVVED